jgi:hypothetical protein
MVAIVAPTPSKSGGTEVLVVNLTVSGSSGNYSYSYDVPHIISQETTGEVQVNLISTSLPSGYSAYIREYACTDVNALVPKSPASAPFAVGTQSAIFSLTLATNQLISFAIFVEITDTSRNTTTVFCDPQIGNDPK